MAMVAILHLGSTSTYRILLCQWQANNNTSSNLGVPGIKICRQKCSHLDKPRSFYVQCILNTYIVFCFSFQILYQQEATNQELFGKTVQPLLDLFIAGFNTSILVYGESGMSNLHF